MRRGAKCIRRTDGVSGSARLLQSVHSSNEQGRSHTGEWDPMQGLYASAREDAYRLTERLRRDRPERCCMVLQASSSAAPSGAAGPI
jgi:hypothetical protein